MSWCWGSILGEHLGNIRLRRLFAQRPGCWFRRLLLIEIQGRHLSGDRCDGVGHDVGGIAPLAGSWEKDRNAQVVQLAVSISDASWSHASVPTPAHSPVS